MLDLLREKNTERKKQENLLNSQKDNWNFQKNFLLYISKEAKFASFFYCQFYLLFVYDISLLYAISQNIYSNSTLEIKISSIFLFSLSVLFSTNSSIAS